MRIIRNLKEMNFVSENAIRKKKGIGFVPTMGALHEGHTSLIRKARQENDFVVASVFVNPMQFGKGEDYKRYPRNIKTDKAKAEKAGCDILFYPDAGRLYPENFSTYVQVKGLSDIMCGASRPGHFKSVATICLKLFNIVMCRRAYFGQKDYQQAIIIKKMAKDLNINVNIRVLPVVREPSGLAMSSRNSYLKPEEYKKAAMIYKSLKESRDLVKTGEKHSVKIISALSKALKCNGMNIDYISVVDPETLENIKQIKKKALIALAVRIGRTRLIDNILVNI
jgi:pantoate--beta-alanine ligase